MSNFITAIRDKFQNGEISLPYGSFVTDTRSSPIEVQFELDVRNDRHLAAWHEKYRLKAFEEGRYGARPFEETVSARRAAAVKPQKATADLAGAASNKVHRINGALAA